MIVAGSRSIAAHAAATRSRCSTKRSGETNGVLYSAAKRAASAGVRLGPPPPMMIGTPPSWTGLGSAGDAADRVVGAVEVERRAGRRRPHPGDDRELLLEAVEALAERRERDGVRLVLALVPAGAEAELDPAAGHLVDAGDRDRQRARAAGTSPTSRACRGGSSTCPGPARRASSRRPSGRAGRRPRARRPSPGSGRCGRTRRSRAARPAWRRRAGRRTWRPAGAR